MFRHPYVFDGQHTIEIVASRSGSRDTPVWCMVYDQLQYQEEAHIFAEQQRHVKALVPYESFKAHHLRPGFCSTLCSIFGLVDALNRKRSEIKLPLRFPLLFLDIVSHCSSCDQALLHSLSELPKINTECFEISAARHFTNCIKAGDRLIVCV